MYVHIAFSHDKLHSYLSTRQSITVNAPTYKMQSKADFAAIYEVVLTSEYLSYHGNPV